MPDTPAPGSAKAKGPLGQPWWVWGVAGAVTIAAAIYLYRKRAAAQNATAAATTGAGTIQAGSFYGWLLDHQTSPGVTTGQPTCPKGGAYDADSKKCIPEKGKGKGGKSGPKAPAAPAAPAAA